MSASIMPFMAMHPEPAHQLRMVGNLLTAQQDVLVVEVDVPS